MKNLIKKLVFNNISSYIYSFFCFLFSRKAKEPNLDTTHSLEYNPSPSSCITKTKNNNHKYNLQIIVPCFNSEKYLKKCLNSLVNQKTQYTINIVLIDDGSSDGTAKICDDFASRHDRITVIHQQNKGFSQARNVGLELVDSDFLIFVDSDDYLIDPYICNKLLEKAYSNKNNKRLIIEFGFRRDKNDKLVGKYRPNNGVLRVSKYNGFAWGKIYSSDLFQNLCFPINYWFEDTFIKLIILFLNNISVYGVSDCSYAYRINPNSITSSYKGNLKTLDSFYILESLLKDAKELGIQNTKSFRNAIMWQIVCTHSRTEYLPSEIQKKIFYKTKDLIKLFPGNYSYQYRHLFKAVINSKYTAYLKICKFLSKTK